MPRVIHFEIPADQPERASRFYNDVFGWNIQKWEGSEEEPYWLVMTGENGAPGINGGLMRRMQPGTSTVNTIDVPSVDEYVARITENGGKVVMPKMPVPTVGWLAYCQDTEGNTFGIMQMDEAAK
jgi:predicted enzyme related to lactoylglutathione lyase